MPQQLRELDTFGHYKLILIISGGLYEAACGFLVALIK